MEHDGCDQNLDDLYDLSLSWETDPSIGWLLFSRCGEQGCLCAVTITRCIFQELGLSLDHVLRGLRPVSDATT